MSSTPVSTSGDVKVRVASHLSKVPFIATDASTSNLIELSVGVISKTGACARLSDGNTAENKKDRMARRMGMTQSAKQHSVCPDLRELVNHVCIFFISSLPMRPHRCARVYRMLTFTRPSGVELRHVRAECW